MNGTQVTTPKLISFWANEKLQSAYKSCSAGILADLTTDRYPIMAEMQCDFEAARLAPPTLKQGCAGLGGAMDVWRSMLGSWGLPWLAGGLLPMHWRHLHGHVQVYTVVGLFLFLCWACLSLLKGFGSLSWMAILALQ